MSLTSKQIAEEIAYLDPDGGQFRLCYGWDEVGWMRVWFERVKPQFWTPKFWPYQESK